MPEEVFYGWSVRRSEGSRTAKGIVGQRTADGRKFLLLFRTAHRLMEARLKTTNLIKIVKRTD